MQKLIHDTLEAARAALERFMADGQQLGRVEAAARLMIATLQEKGSLYSCGNGGSMSDAMHFAEELTGRYRDNRAALSATAISDPGHISCVANDFGYEQVFSRYLEGRGRPGDCLLAISTSGNSANVIAAAAYARANGIRVVSLTGKPGSRLGQLADVDVSVGASAFADRIQELHIKVIHLMIELIEREFFPANYKN